MQLFEQRSKWNKIKANNEKASHKIALLSSFTIKPIEPYLGYKFYTEAQTKCDIWEAPYNQIEQQCVDEQSELYKFNPNIILLFFNFEDIGGYEIGINISAEQLIESSIRLIRNCIEAANKLESKILVVLPHIPFLSPDGIYAPKHPDTIYAICSLAREAMRRYLFKYKNLSMVDCEELCRYNGVESSFNWQLQAVARIPYSEVIFEQIAHSIVHRLGQTRPEKYHLIIDGDNTLWGGELELQQINEINLSPNSVGQAFIDLQKYIKALVSTGNKLLLHNKIENRMSALFKRKEMILNENDFVFIGNEKECKEYLSINNVSQADCIYLLNESNDKNEFSQLKNKIIIPADASNWPSVFIHPNSLGF